MSTPYYVVTILEAGYSEPVSTGERVGPSGDPDVDADRIIDKYAERGDEVLHIRWSDGGMIYAAPGIDR